MNIVIEDTEETAKAPLARGERRAILANFAAPALDQNPVAVYLARFPSKDGRRVQLGALRAVAKEFGAEDPFSLPWGELKYQHVVLLRTKFEEKGLSPATVNRYLSAIRGVVEEAVRLNILDAAEGTKIASVKGVRGERLPAGRHLEPEQDLEPLFDAAAEHENPTIAIRDQALLAALRVAGMRRAELVKIQLSDLDWGKVRTVAKGKGKKRVEREVYTLDGTWKCTLRGKGNKERRAFLENAAPELKAWLKVRGMAPGPLFCAVHKSGSVQVHRQMNPSSIGFIVARAGEAAGVKASPHDFRRTMVGDLLDAGADIATVQKIAGHADIKTTARYDRRPEKTAEKAAAMLKVPKGKRQTE